MCDWGCGVAQGRGRVERIFAWWFGIAAMGIATWYLRSWGIGLLTVALWCIYELFFVPTTCSAQTKKGTGCDIQQNGRIRAHSTAHQRIKNDAIWDLLTGRSNPFARFRFTWARTGSQQGIVFQSASTPGRQVQGGSFRELIMLILAIIGTLATVFGTWLSYLSLISH